MTTLELVNAAKAKDRAAFGALVARYQDMATGYALGILRDPGAAEDAAQDAFVEAYDKLEQLRDPAAFGGWLRRIVFKHCDRRTRRRRPEVPEAPEAAVTADEALDRDRARAWVRAAVEGLPEHERIVVALHYFGESAQPDVADFLELPLSTVKKRLYSARRRLEAQRSRDMSSLRPSHDRTFTERVALFLAIRAEDRDGAAGILDRHPDWVDAPERWSRDAALEGEFPLAHRLTPLVLAAGQGSLPMLELLLERGASVDGRCGCVAGETPLFAAVSHGRNEACERLLAAGADPNASNDVGHTPLHVAEIRGARAIAEALRAAGADPTRPAHNGRTPEDYRGTARAFVRAEGGRIVTGIKAIDLLAPLAPRMRVRVHAAAETGLMVLMSELSHRLASAGWRVVWTTRAVHPWQRRELADVVAKANLQDRVEVEIDGLPASEAPGAPDLARFVFRAPGHEAEVDAVLADLASQGGLAFVIDPWVPVTKAERPTPDLAPPYDALLVTDPGMAGEGLYPALDPRRCASRLDVDERQSSLQQEVRGAATDPSVRAFISQPFFVAQHVNGMMGADVGLSDTLDGFERIVSGHGPEDPGRLRYLGALGA